MLGHTASQETVSIRTTISESIKGQAKQAVETGGPQHHSECRHAAMEDQPGASMGLRPDNDDRRASIPSLRAVQPNFVGFAEMKLKSLLQTGHHRLYGDDSGHVRVALKVAIDERAETFAGVSASDRKLRSSISEVHHDAAGINPQEVGGRAPAFRDRQITR